MGCIAKKLLPLAVILLWVIHGCSGNRPTAQAGREVVHVATSGDTLYSIAWMYGKNWRDLAALNRIRAPYVIRIGQRIRIDGKIPPPPVDRPQRAAPKRAAAKPRPVPVAASTALWRWPADGVVLQKFSTGARPHKGIDLRGAIGDPVFAAKDGEVVYAGTGIRGYGKLLIVKHGDNYLSAYAHNNRVLVSEGQSVVAGQRIAEIGRSGTDSVKLHFEVRRNGIPLNPLSLLPPR